ncbi:MAG: diguanylate cyclase, partial [Pseudomonadota bacterium]|nr:diguanylate cyclase [Pseudomonadota bacterium]
AQGLYLHEASGWQPLQDAPQLAQMPVDLLYADGDGNLWAGSDTALARIRDARLVEYVDAAGPGGIAGLRTAFEDREGNLWFGSQWESLIRISDSWTQRFGVAEGLNDPIVWSVSPDPDGRRIWVGSNDGVSLLEDGRFTLVVPGSALPQASAYNLLAERERLWIGTRRGLAVLDHAGPLAGVVQTPAAFAPLASAQIAGIVREHDGLWLASSEGLYHLADSPPGQQLRRYAQADGLADPRVRFFLRTREGQVLVATQSGLFEMRGERFFPVGLDTGLPAGLDVSAIHQLKDGRLLIGSISEQTYLRHAGRWHLLGEGQGLPTNVITAMVERAGYLWLAGIRGISRVPVTDLTAFASGQVDRMRGEMLLSDRGDPMSGQAGYCCNGAGTAKGFLRGEVFWLPSRDGVVAIHTDAIKLNPVPPPVVIERVQIDRQWRQATSLQAPELPAASRDLEFEFTVLSFQDPKSVRVQYRMSGYDRDWRDADPLNRNARYTNLPPGDYVFEVRGGNNAGVPSVAPAQWPFSIQPRFHETSWFLALLGLGLAALVYGGYRYQQHRYRMQRDVLNALVHERTEALELANRQLGQANHHLEEASQSDLLTGLRNRRYMASQIPVDLAYYDRQFREGAHEGEVIVFALIDIDHFKTVNDDHGHRAGDLVLQQFAQVLNDLVRSGDYVVRWGGEEFLLVFRPMPTRNLQIIGNRLREAVLARVFDIGDGQLLRLSASIGLVEYPLFGEQLGWEAMVELADQAMYHVKTHGRDGWAAFRPTSATDPDTLLQ